MAIFNVPREGRNKVGYMEHLIYNMYLCEKIYIDADMGY